MPFLTPIKSLVLCIGWKSDDIIQHLDQPIMLISGMHCTVLCCTKMLSATLTSPFLHALTLELICIVCYSNDLSYSFPLPLSPYHPGDSDELVPPSHMKKLSELASKSRNLDFYSVSGGGHNDTFGKYMTDLEFVTVLFSITFLSNLICSLSLLSLVWLTPHPSPPPPRLLL